MVSTFILSLILYCNFHLSSRGAFKKCGNIIQEIRYEIWVVLDLQRNVNYYFASLSDGVVDDVEENLMVSFRAIMTGTLCQV